MILLKINVIILLLFIQSSVYSAFVPIDNKINYQGELLDNGVDANGLYDFQFQLCFEDTHAGIICQGAIGGDMLGIEVSNSLFNISDIDFGPSFFGASSFIKIYVKKSNTGDPFVLISPLQKIHAVPYASYSIEAGVADTLVSNGAVNGQYLKFNGSEWVPSSLVIPASPWDISGSDISYSSGKVGVGTVDAATKLEVNSDLGEDSFSVSTDNSDKFLIKANGDTKQSVSSNGMLKYMLELTCNEAANGGSTINKFYDGTIMGTSVTVSDGDVGKPGTCKIIITPSTFNVFDRYVIAAAKGSGSPALGAQCLAVSPTELQCFRYVTSTGLGASSGKITVLIY